MDYSELKGKVRGKFGTQEAFAQALGLSACAVNQKLNGKSQWSANEICVACELLGISPEEMHVYFFCPKS